MKSNKKKTSTSKVTSNGNSDANSGSETNDIPTSAIGTLSNNEFEREPINIVCIGGSAGSVDALEKFFKNLPTTTGMSFVVIQHLDPTQRGMMPDLISRWTTLPVKEVENGEKVKPEHIYVIPPNREMSIVNSTLMLFEPSKPRGFRMPIDIFMESLAKDQGEKAVGIILSGLDSDGVQGASFIKENFGMVMVQSPETSQFESMPVHTIQKEIVDIIAAPEELPKKLVGYVEHFNRLDIPREEKDSSQKYNDALQKIFLLLKNQTGHDFSMYKKNTIDRRIERRMNAHQITDIDDYVKYMQQNPSEAERLFKELLIGVTKFYRDDEAFHILEKDVIPQIIKDKKREDYIRIWCAGVSTGEEVYSVAITVLECLDEMSEKKRLNVQIFATDLDREAIEKARAGIFLPSITSDVSKERLERYFIKDGDCYQIKKEVRELIIFANHNLIKDAPFTKLDLITCRNLLIYLSPDLQKKIFPLFHYALLPQGYLFLGPSESLGSFQDLFRPVDQKWKIFKRREGDSFSMVDFPFYLSGRDDRTKLNRIDVHSSASKKPNFSTTVNHILLGKYAPSAVLINSLGDIFYLHGRTGKYLELASGDAQMNILQMAREGLKYELNSAILKANSRKNHVQTNGIKINTDGGHLYINLTVIYISEPEAVRDLLLVVFEEIPENDSHEKREIPIGKTTKRDNVIIHLEKELEITKQQLQSTLEEMEASFEEIKSANEELQSTNEELQSINEESISSKEEMQSLNEELMAVNIDYQTKTDELTRANNDMKNLLDSTEIATIFIDNKLNIKRYTPEASKIINIIPSDIGRPLAHIVSNLKYDRLLKDVSEVLEKLATKEVQVQTTNDRWYSMRLFPYRTISNYIDGVVITFSDITKLKVLEEELNETLLFAESIINSVRDPLVILDRELRVLSVSQTFANIFALNPKHIKGESLTILNNGILNIPNLRDALRNVVSEGIEFNDIIVEKDFNGSGHKKLLINGRPIGRNQKTVRTILLAIEDITNK